MNWTHDDIAALQKILDDRYDARYVKITKCDDTVVCGGGVAGVCAAVAAARHGLKTALIQNRSVLGGNGSSEMTININGAAYDGNSPSVYAAETGIVQELKLMMAHYGDRDIAFYELVYGEENLTLYLETQVDQVVIDDKEPYIEKSFNQYCTKLRHQYFFIPEQTEGEHTVTITLLDEVPQIKAELKEKYPNDPVYNKTEAYFGKILVRGEILSIIENPS